MLRRIALASLTLALFACSTIAPPPPSNVALPSGSKVGLLIALDSSAVHEHVGTTVFNNFSAQRSLPWDLRQRASEVFSENLASAGFEVVSVGGTGLGPEGVNALVVPAGDSWVPNPEQASSFKRLKDDLGLSAVVVVYQTRTLAHLECAGGPCSPRYVGTSGLFSRSFMGMTRSYAVPAFETKVFSFVPPSNLSAVDPMATVARHKVKMVRLAEPKDFKNLTDDEFKPVTDWIATYLTQIASASAAALRGPR